MTPLVIGNEDRRTSRRSGLYRNEEWSIVEPQMRLSHPHSESVLASERMTIERQILLEDHHDSIEELSLHKLFVDGL